MPNEAYRSNRPLWKAMHPSVFGAAFGCLATMLAVLWLGFGSAAYTALQLAVCTFFAAVFAATPYLMWRLSKTSADGAAVPFKEWAVGDLAIFGGRINAGESAVLLLLVPVATTAGVAVMGLIWRMAAAGAL